ncbi:MAG TPA: hypothetical protein VKZ84_01915 [Bacteriovoracaceae bacterium]|nr:hypothetical protein [Bacteriovoracaceae bacterium]
MNTLKVFVVANPATYNEWAILKGTKYFGALDFDWEFTSEVDEANVFIWDGVKNIVSQNMFSKVEKKISSEGHILLWVRLLDFFEKFKSSVLIDLDQTRYVEVNESQLCPETMIWALNECKKKLTHVR